MKTHIQKPGTEKEMKGMITYTRTESYCGVVSDRCLVQTSEALQPYDNTVCKKCVQAEEKATGEKRVELMTEEIVMKHVKKCSGCSSEIDHWLEVYRDTESEDPSSNYGSLRERVLLACEDIAHIHHSNAGTYNDEDQKEARKEAGSARTLFKRLVYPGYVSAYLSRPITELPW